MRATATRAATSSIAMPPRKQKNVAVLIVRVIATATATAPVNQYDCVRPGDAGGDGLIDRGSNANSTDCRKPKTQPNSARAREMSARLGDAMALWATRAAIVSMAIPGLAIRKYYQPNSASARAWATRAAMISMAMPPRKPSTFLYTPRRLAHSLSARIAYLSVCGIYKYNTNII